MANSKERLAEAWRLPTAEQQLLAVLPPDHLDDCLDISLALACLLGDSALARQWMWQRKAWLFHARPVDVALTSHRGCRHLRAQLLDELAQAGADTGIAAVCWPAPRGAPGGGLP